jgi:hypothetical protein
VGEVLRRPLEVLLGEVRLLQSQFDVPLADRHHLMPGQAHQPGYRREGHLPAHRHDQRFEQQREAGQPSGPVGFDLPNTPLGQSHPWDTDRQVTLMLEEVQVPVALGNRVVGWVSPLNARHGKATAGDEINANGQRLLAGIEIDALDKPDFDTC